MDKELIEALEAWRRSVRAMFETFADDTYINGTSNGQFRKFDSADEHLQQILAEANKKLVTPPAAPPAA